MKFKTMLFTALALCLAMVAMAPAADAKTSYVSVYSGWISDGSTTPQNSLGVYVTPTFPNNSIAFNVTSLHIKSSYYSGNNALLAEGDSYDYYDAARITVLDTRVYDGIPQAYIDISEITTVNRTEGTMMYSDTPGLVAKAGDTVSFSIVIQNNDNVDHTYSLATSSSADWHTAFKYQNKEIYQIYVPATQSKTVALEVDTPYTASLGEQKFTVYADSYAINLRVDVTSVNESVAVSTPGGSSVIASLGNKAYYDFTLENLQNEQNGYKLSVTGLPENWYYMYLDSRSSTSEMAEAIVAGSASKNLVLAIVPSNSAGIGEYNFTAVITTPDGVEVTKDLTLKLKGGASLSTSYDKLSYTSKPGQSFTINVYATNNGQGSALTNVYPSVEAPTGWTVSTSPESVSSIKAGEMQVFKVTVQPPANIVASDYDVKVTVKSDQANSGTLDYRIAITTDSYIPYLAGGIIVVVLAGIVLVFRKYGRR
ncbi:NEW3 domain-containing protein [Methanocella sp. MCL-LM]|uniref:COG1470 family protein n=1 Tax=Methanocella sp. MCL-LM TaxID=3412035 RepID=UPI003C73785A